MLNTTEPIAPPNRLAELRAGKRASDGGKCTQQVAASAVGISYNRYWRIENREAEATADERERLASYFGVPEGRVFPRRRRVA